jgi:hypothetical protein
LKAQQPDKKVFCRAESGLRNADLQIGVDKITAPPPSNAGFLDRRSEKSTGIDFFNGLPAKS